MRNGHTIASVTDDKSGATVAYVQNEKGTATQREVTFDVLGESRTVSVQEAIAGILARTDGDLRKSVRASLKS